MKKHIVCFGDSNTHGYCADPRDCADGGDRFNEAERWPCLLQALLGDDYLVLEEGLSGRTTCFDDPLTEGLSGLSYITPCLMSHEKVDLLVIMLGTNDVKDRFGCTPGCIAQALERLVRKAQATQCWKTKPNILVVAPPPIGEGMYHSDVAPIMGYQCAKKSRALPAAYRATCQTLGIPFLDAAEAGCEFNTIDCMHLTKKGHAALARALAQLIPGLV